MSSGNFRHGIALPPQRVKKSFADIAQFENFAIPQSSSDAWKSASGGCGRTEAHAKLAAIGEYLERYAALAFNLPKRKKKDIPGARIDLGEFAFFSNEQMQAPGFPYTQFMQQDHEYTNVFSLYTNEETWVPAFLVSLDFKQSNPFTTSSGLACGQTKYQALLRSLQEIVERDAFMITWLHGIPGRQVKLGHDYTDEVEAKHGRVTCIDATPAYSTHPVAIVTGYVPLRGLKRIALGVACRETWDEALEKAFLEWFQGVAFAGVYASYFPNTKFASFADVHSFDDHATYYTFHPEQWAEIPLLKGRIVDAPKTAGKSAANCDAIKKLLDGLQAHGIRVFYRDLTTPDLRQVGASTMRALSPDLTPIHFEQKFPFIGGRAKDVTWRYPWARDITSNFPNPYPHPLG